MKYTVIANIIDGVIAASKNHIVCFDESTLSDENGDSLYFSEEGIYIGQILTEKMHRDADAYWRYSKKDWDLMNQKFIEFQNKI